MILAGPHAMSPTAKETVVQETLRIPVGAEILTGDRVVPADAVGMVLFAHGSGSGRLSPRNRFVAEALQAAGLATLLVDLLTVDEERRDAVTRECRFDMTLLTRRLTALADWHATGEWARLPLGCFGASTGSAAALNTAAERREVIRAVVSRGGRPDLAAAALAHVAAPTLLIVGGDDTPVIEMNRTAWVQLRCEKQLKIVPGATHLFEEPGTLEEVAGLAREWFMQHLTRME